MEVIAIIHRASVLPALFDDFFEDADVVGEHLASLGGQSAGRARPTVLKCFGDGDVPGLLKGAKLNAKIAIGQVQAIAKFSERKLRRRREQRHNGKPRLFVDDLVELLERVGVHSEVGLDRVM